jgi:hypothetical protein
MVAREEEEREEGIVQKGRGDCGIQDLRYVFYFKKGYMGWASIEDEVLICLQGTPSVLKYKMF